MNIFLLGISVWLLPARSFAYGQQFASYGGLCKLCGTALVEPVLMAERVQNRRTLRPMNSTQTIVDRELFITALRHMSEDDLLFLNRLVVERLNLLAQAKSTVQLAQFSVGDRVEFTANNGVLKCAVIVRLNKKTASLRTDDDQAWNVSPSLLRKISGTAS